MSSLTQTAIFSRKALRVFALFLVAAFILLIFFLTGRAIVRSLFPKGQLPATVAFGLLPPYVYNGVEPLKGAQYSVETISGGLPLLSDKAKVFSIAQVESSFGARERAIIKAGRIGFSASPEEPSSGILKFTETKDRTRSLTVNVFTNQFRLESDYLGDPEIATSRPNSDEDAITMASNFFKTYGFDMSDFPTNLATAQKYKVEDGKLVEALSLSDTNVIKVNFRRSNLDNLPVFWPIENSSEINAIVSQKEVVAAEGNMLAIEKNTFSTYPLKGVVKAFEDLKLGKASYSRSSLEKIVPIINVSLGYIEDVSEPAYLQPVYIFEGPENFIAYVSAVDKKWVTEESKRDF